MSRHSSFKPTNLKVRGKEPSHQQVELELKQKNQELQFEVKDLKQKLDELRKAKSTTLVKREKEFVSKLTSCPTLKHKFYKYRHCCLHTINSSVHIISSSSCITPFHHVMLLFVLSLALSGCWWFCNPITLRLVT